MPQAQDSEFFAALRKGALVGLGLLVLVLPPVWIKKHHDAQEQAQREAVAVAPRPAEAPQAAPPEVAPRPLPGVPVVRLADFRGEDPSPDARMVANWVVHTRNARRHAFVIVDKQDARVYVFGADGRLKDSAPALLGAARGDDSFPGIGEKPLEQVRPEEKTTPAGRFVAEPGMNAGNEDVVWVSYDLAVSMHRVRPLHAREHRLERLASLTIDDNRISFGCINLPVTFYENVVAPTVRQYGAIVYVLPEVRTPQEVFGAYDVTDPIQLAAARDPAIRPLQQVVLRAAGALQPER
ncbi:hypothetical protein [Ramlibacter alkalitolerans]|uniref:L,D-transpeptidase n=1 Tax=Ramlibacter alkalitolerans TaxID=2039631 RepID=A0ABS1JVM7_9BURK|nr:hypothetical protein [Ramlibacter alkalitolerans]MBL0428257.1 hypothetical protein [Ramlibacter alkalitolerans]